MIESAEKWVEHITKSEPQKLWRSDELRDLILSLGGKMYSSSNIERRARESSLIKSVRFHSDKTPVGYQWA